MTEEQEILFYHKIALTIAQKKGNEIGTFAHRRALDAYEQDPELLKEHAAMLRAMRARRLDVVEGRKGNTWHSG